MPKELTHIIIAEEALKRVEAIEPEAAKVLRNNKSVYLLASIVCDTAYYHIPFSGARFGLSYISENIHTKRGDIDTGFLLRLANSKVLRENREAHFAFFCGILSHHIADRRFHPAIFYLTGDLGEADSDRLKAVQARHRFLEGIIDLGILSTVRGGVEGKIGVGRYLPQPPARLVTHLACFVEAAVPGCEGNQAARLAKKLYYTLHFQRILLYFLSNGLFRWSMVHLNRLSGYRFSPYVALCYPERKYLKSFLTSGDFRPYDAFTGTPVKGRFEDIAVRSAGCIAEAISELYRNYTGSDVVPEGKVPQCLTDNDNAGRAVPQYFDFDEVEKALSRFLGRKGGLHGV